MTEQTNFVVSVNPPTKPKKWKECKRHKYRLETLTLSDETERQMWICRCGTILQEKPKKYANNNI